MKRRVMVALLSVVLAMAGAVALSSFLGEPRYQGRRLSDWLEDPELEETDIRAAVRAIGTNAIPSFQKWLLDEASWIEVQASYLNSRQNWLYLDYTPSIDANIRAMRGFFYLEELAAPAIPWLMEGVGKGNNDFTFYARALLAIGEPGREALMSAYPGMNASEKEQVVRAAYLHVVLDADTAPFYARFIREEDVELSTTAMLLVRNLRARCPQVLFDAIRHVEQTGEGSRQATALDVALDLLEKQPGLLEE